MAAHVDEDALTLAIRHVALSRQIVWQQRDRIERLKALGADATRAEETLRVFESNLKIFEDHREFLASLPRRFPVVGTSLASAPNPPRSLASPWAHPR